MQPDPKGPWALQLAAAIRAVGVISSPPTGQLAAAAVLERAARERHLQRVVNATAHGGHTKLQHYATVSNGSLIADCYGTAAFLDEVRTVALLRPLAQVRAGSHYGKEGRGGHKKLAHTERQCLHGACLGGPGGIETVKHMFCLPLSKPVRKRYPQLLVAGPTSLHLFLEQQPHWQ